jgi:hypothetical protein
MRRWVPILCAAIALVAMIGLPSKWVRYGACCHGDGKIPGVTCCGRPQLDAHQQSVTQHRNCCVPLVFEAAKLDVLVVSMPPVPSVRAAAGVLDGPVEPWICAPIREVLPNLSPTGPPSTGSPLLYVLFSCILI